MSDRDSQPVLDLQRIGKVTSLSWVEFNSGPRNSPVWTCQCKIDGVVKGTGSALQKYVAKDKGKNLSMIFTSFFETNYATAGEFSRQISPYVTRLVSPGLWIDQDGYFEIVVCEESAMYAAENGDPAEMSCSRYSTIPDILEWRLCP
ncbi:hypothetical protein C8J56DRAFT_882838 [Mycena floridula]|nr:hypothetical protein C8J56DRAFT_882838 [Mycena floridula]